MEISLQSDLKVTCHQILPFVFWNVSVTSRQNMHDAEIHIPRTKIILQTSTVQIYMDKEKFSSNKQSAKLFPAHNRNITLCSYAQSF